MSQQILAVQLPQYTRAESTQEDDESKQIFLYIHTDQSPHPSGWISLAILVATSRESEAERPRCTSTEIISIHPNMSISWLLNISFGNSSIRNRRRFCIIPRVARVSNSSLTFPWRWRAALDSPTEADRRRAHQPVWESDAMSFFMVGHHWVPPWHIHQRSSVESTVIQG